MHVFTILPSDPSCPPTQVEADHAGTVLKLIQQCECHHADVFRDGEYFFSISLDDQGVWSIVQQDETTTPKFGEYG